MPLLLAHHVTLSSIWHKQLVSWLKWAHCAENNPHAKVVLELTAPFHAHLIAATAVHDGYLLSKTLTKSPVGGHLLNLAMQKVETIDRPLQSVSFQCGTCLIRLIHNPRAVSLYF